MTVVDDCPRTGRTLQENARDWLEEYGRGAYMLARITAMDITRTAPEQAEGWFLLAQTHMALREFRRARRALEQVLEAPGGNAIVSRGVGVEALRQAAGQLIAILDERRAACAPKEPLHWLEDLERVGSVKPVPDIGIGGVRIGRVEPLMDPAKMGPLGCSKSALGPLSGVLGSQLPYAPIERQSMADLLGRDAGIEIEKGRIRIIDGTVSIDKGRIQIIDGSVAIEKGGIQIIDGTVKIDRMEPSSLRTLGIGGRPVVHAAATTRAPLPSATTASNYYTPPTATPTPIAGAAATRTPAAPAVAVPAAAPVVTDSAKPLERTRPPGASGAASEQQAKPDGARGRKAVLAAGAAALGGAVAARAAQAAGQESTAAEATPQQSAAPQAASAPVGADPWAMWEADIKGLLESGSADEALRRVEEAVARYPTSGRLQELRGSALEHLGRGGEAAKAWGEAFSRYQKMGRTQQAAEAWKQAARLARRDGDLLLDLASVAAAAGAIAVAIGAARVAAEISRRESNNRRLLKALRRLVEWGDPDKSLRDEIERVTPLARGSGRVSPPGVSAAAAPAPKLQLAPLDDAEQFANRRKPVEKSEGVLGAALMLASFAVLVISIALRSGTLGLVGFIATTMLAKAAKTADGRSDAAFRTAQTVFLLAMFIGFIL